MKLNQKLLLGICSIALLQFTACNCPECPECPPAAESKGVKGNPPKVNKYGPVMIANYHQNLTLDQYRATKMLTMTVADLQGIIDKAVEKKSNVIHFFEAATIEGLTNETNPDVCQNPGPGVPTIVISIPNDDGTVTTYTTCVQFCPPPTSCGDSIPVITDDLIPGVTSMTLNEIIKYKFKTTIPH